MTSDTSRMASDQDEVRIESSQRLDGSSDVQLHCGTASESNDPQPTFGNGVDEHGRLGCRAPIAVGDQPEGDAQRHAERAESGGGDV